MHNLVLVIIDDEPKVAEALKGLITKILFPNKGIEVHITNSVKQGVDLIQKQLPDIVFLDIRMPDEVGFELFNQVDLRHTKVVFTTAYAEYAIESINKFGCLGYLLKPIGLDDLNTVFNRYKEEQSRNKTQYLKFIADNGKRTLLNLEEVLLFKASSNYCEIYLKDRKYILAKTLKEILEGQDNHIIRVHRSYGVNLKYISHYTGKSLLFKGVCNNQLDGFISEIPIGETYLDTIKEYFL
ncbi:LytR/AlgR family response regulator transcription factor [Myroides guanonis]|uniref:Two component transcriptional regulator, LytTR family n=1 Tax=Myroides guanonis TaxID=1150112 RepID=A0A1I3LL77_9FLAO|nr:LytTR family DNA-binding domain-containing protein [Myroides guanonis]SFI85226.1 two component transcriptional regulator, LytTR family [Myroides guanonis]